MTAKRSFRPLVLTALVLIASLSCYLISLRVASERAALEGVERDIAMVTRDIRSLETEIGTRGRLAQLERWNARFLRLGAPRAEQFVDTGFHLANLVKPADRTLEAPIVLASADVPAQSDEMESPAAPAAADLMQVASLEREVPAKPVAKAAPQKAAPKADRLAPRDEPRDPLAPIEVGASR